MIKFEYYLHIKFEEYKTCLEGKNIKNMKTIF